MRCKLYTILLATFIVTISALAQEIPPHLRDVRELQEHVLPENNSYRHRDSIVEWKGYAGATKYVCHTDCSGLIDALLEHSYHLNKEFMQKWLGRPHAKARTYFRVISENNGFQRIQRIQDLLPGDFVAMEFLPWAADAGHDTGHIMVVNDMPRKVGQRVKDGLYLTEWSVQVIDSSSHGHGKTDTRYRQGRYYPGIGKGVAALYTNPEGVLIGYSWTPNEKSVFHGNSDRPLVAGRIQ